MELDYETLKARLLEIEIVEMAMRTAPTRSPALIEPWVKRPAPEAPAGRYVAIHSVLGEVLFYIPGRDLYDRDLRGYCFDTADLSGLDLHGANLDDCSMLGVKAIGTSFRCCSLRNVDMRYSTLEGATFDHADLRDALLCVSAVLRANFSYALVNPNSRIPDDPQFPRKCRIVVRERRLGWE